MTERNGYHKDGDCLREAWRWRVLLAGWLIGAVFGVEGLALGGETGLTKSGAVPPELTGGPWLNVPAGTNLTLKAHRGRVTVVHFWTFGCINCKRNLPIYAQWQGQFAWRGVRIIGIHTPETESERNLTNVARKVRELGITYPVLVDQGATNWNRWGQKWWPTVYLIDKQGRARFAWEGELEYRGAGGGAKLAGMIEQLLRE